MRFVIILFITSLLFGATFDDFNAFYDFEKDMINHPEKTVFGRIIRSILLIRQAM